MHSNAPAFGYLIVYVEDVASTVAFYEAAFALERRFVHESGAYAEMETGATALAFAARTMADMHGVELRARDATEPASPFEIAFVVPDPAAAVERAVAAGATLVSAVERKPWGQDVGYVRDRDGTLVELCTALG